MESYKIKYVDVFTTEPFKGNSVGVVLGADGLTTDLMFRIAGEMNLSETTFVSRSGSADTLCRIRFFTPSIEYDLSGHAMIGTCFAIAEEGLAVLGGGRTRIHLETNMGSIPIDYYCSGSPEGVAAAHGARNSSVNAPGPLRTLEKIMMHQEIQSHRETDVPVSNVADMLSIDPSEITQTGLPLEIVANGLTQLLIPVKSCKTVQEMQPDLAKVKLLNNRIGVQTSDIFTLDSLDPRSITYSRHFSPATGMWEDPGSGAAAVSIANYLKRHGVIGNGSFVMDQGNDIEALSKVLVDIEDSESESDSAWVGGLAVTSITRSVSLLEDGVQIS